MRATKTKTYKNNKTYKKIKSVKKYIFFTNSKNILQLYFFYKHLRKEIL